MKQIKRILSLYKCAYLLAILPIITFCYLPLSEKDLIDNFENSFLNRALDDQQSSLEEKNNTPDKSLSCHSQKPWTIIVYMAADNDLRPFAKPSINQMMQIGSNEHVNILVHLDIKLGANNKITRRYLINRKDLSILNEHDTSTHKMNSGSPETLYSCLTWAITEYPAEHYALVFWNHGSGCLEPHRNTIVDSSDPFFHHFFNKKSDEDVGNCISPHWIFSSKESQRGICWDASHGSFITNNQLDAVLEKIRKNVLDGKKFEIIAFDACLMSMIEVAHIVKKHAYYMIGSQDSELGPGWNYSYALAPFAHNVPTSLQLVENIVQAYAKAYSTLTQDYTQSAIDLSSVHELEQNIDSVARLLINLLSNTQANSIKHAIRSSMRKGICTRFDNPNYIDLYHFYANLHAKIGHTSTELQDLLGVGKKIIEKVIIINRSGKNMSNARGISIYLPEHHFDRSYQTLGFSRLNSWGSFLARITSSAT